MFSGDAYKAARRGAALIERANRGRIVVSGADRASYLHGLLTNDITALKAGQGCYAAYLTPQGRMIADLFVYELGDIILLSMSRHVKDTMMAKLDQFIFAEDVQIGDATDTFGQVAIVGPEAALRLTDVLEGVSREGLQALPEHGNTRAAFAGAPVILARETDAGEPGFGVYIERAHVDALISALAAAGVARASAETAEVIRIEAGVPLFGRDMDEETIPLEAGIEPRAISFTKGCYVGQEVIIRVLHRGHGRIARKLVGLTLGEGARVPAAAAIVHSGEREIGHVTSSAWSPALARPIALAYLQRDFFTPGTEVSVDDGRAVVTELPFVQERG